MSFQNKRLVGIVATVAVLLSIPFLAMRFTNEVNWTALDFITMGFLLLMTGLAIEVSLRIFNTTWMKIAAVVGILFGFVMVWGTLVHLGG